MQTPAPGLSFAPNSTAARILAVIPTGSHGMQFAGIVAALPKIYWKTISKVLRQLVAAGLVEQLESRTATLNGVKYPHYTFRYRMKANADSAGDDPNSTVRKLGQNPDGLIVASNANILQASSGTLEGSGGISNQPGGQTLVQPPG